MNNVYILLFLFCLICTTPSPSCADATSITLCNVADNERIPDPNLCTSATDAKGRPLPNCVNTGPSDTVPQWVCAECSHNCDCDPGEYCPKGPGQFTGSCRKLSKDDRIGRGCVRFGYPGTRDGWEVPVRGSTDHLVCGSPIFAGNGTFLRYDWIGACIKGVCNECEGGPMGWTLTTALNSFFPVWKTGNIPFDGSTATMEAHRSRDDGTLSCPGSFCKYGGIARSGAWLVELLPDGINTAILIITIMMWITILAWFIAWFCCDCIKRRMDRSRRKKELVEVSRQLVNDDEMTGVVSSLNGGSDTVRHRDRTIPLRTMSKTHSRSGMVAPLNKSFVIGSANGGSCDVEDEGGASIV